MLSRRLKDLEAAGIVAREASRSESGAFEYRLTASGRELGPIVEAFGIWGQRRIEADLSLQHLDVQLLMWDMRRNLNPTPMPQGRKIIHFIYPELPATQRSWWLIVDPKDGVDLCSVDPGFDVDLYVSVDLRTMTAIWLGLDTVRAAVANKRMILTGERRIASAMQTWLGLSPFAKEKKLSVPMAPDPKREIYGKYAEKYIPRNFIVGKDGKIKLASVGYSETTFQEIVETLERELK